MRRTLSAMGRLRNAVFSAILRGTDVLVRCLSPRFALETAAGLGELYYYLSSRRRRIALENLRIAFGNELDERERRRIARGSFANWGRVLVEFIAAERIFGSVGAARKKFHFHGDWDALMSDADGARGGLLVTLHLGNWEGPTWTLQAREGTLRPVMRSLDNPVFDAYVARRRGADKIIRKQGAVRTMIRTLEAGDWVGFLGDQNAGRRGVFVPFFGRQASTFATPAVVMLRTGAPTYVGACVRRRGSIFDGHVRRIEPPPAHLPDKERVRLVLTEMNRAFEAWIRATPEQYNWSHRRWKARPVGEVPGPDQPFYARYLGAAGASDGL